MYKQLLLYFIFVDVQKIDEGNIFCVVYEKNEMKVRGDFVVMKFVFI